MKRKHRMKYENDKFYIYIKIKYCSDNFLRIKIMNNCYLHVLFSKKNSL